MAKGLNPFEFRASFGPCSRATVVSTPRLNPFEFRASFGLDSCFPLLITSVLIPLNSGLHLDLAEIGKEVTQADVLIPLNSGLHLDLLAPPVVK